MRLEMLNDGQAIRVIKGEIRQHIRQNKARSTRTRTAKAQSGAGGWGQPAMGSIPNQD